jgi:hypothetical protein
LFWCTLDISNINLLCHLSHLTNFGITHADFKFAWVISEFFQTFERCLKKVSGFVGFLLRGDLLERKKEKKPKCN